MEAMIRPGLDEKYFERNLKEGCAVICLTEFRLVSVPNSQKDPGTGLYFILAPCFCQAFLDPVFAKGILLEHLQRQVNTTPLTQTCLVRINQSGQALVTALFPVFSFVI